MAFSNPEKDRLPLVLDVASLPTNAASMSYMSEGAPQWTCLQVSVPTCSASLWPAWLYLNCDWE